MNKTPDELTEDFLQKMRAETGVSWRFLNSARLLVRRVFVEVSLESREGCLASLSRAFARQAEIENLATEAKAALEAANKRAKQEQLIATNGLFGAKTKQVLH